MTAISRRSFLAASGAVVALPWVGTAFAQRANVARIAMAGVIRTLDPAMVSSADEYIYTAILFNGLVRIKPDMTLAPDLATSWEWDSAQTSITFKLRSGIKFHHGKEMTSEDVVATFRRIMDPATGSIARNAFDMIESVNADGPLAVVFKLKFPYTGFVEILGDRQAKIVPADSLANLASMPIGTGPFKFQSNAPGDRLVLSKFDGYWEEGLPKLAGVELRMMPEMTSRLNALRAGDIDIVWELNPEDIKTLGENKALRVESITSASWDTANLNNSIAPFNDVRVRQAFHLAIDKQDVIDLTLFGNGERIHSPIAPSSPAFAKDIPFSKADPAAARSLLKAAGYANGLKVPLVVPVGRAIRERLGVTLQQLGRPGGFEIEIQRVPSSRYLAEIAGKAPLYTDGYLARPTLDTATYSFLHSNGNNNKLLFNYKNPAMDTALEAARRAPAGPEQLGHYHKVQEILTETPAGFFAYSLNFGCAYRAELKGVVGHPMRWFDLRSASFA
jgi:peptide/nickel transport system substrate-binding protein